MNQLFQWSPPPFIPMDSWEAFVEMRKAKGKRAPFTEKARDLLVRQLKQMHEQGVDIGAALDQSTINGWSGVFPPKQTMHSRREDQYTSKQAQGLMILQGMKR